MTMNFAFVVNSVLLGVGLAMDAFSVSIANALADPGMRRRKMYGIAGMFALFQALMPLTGWVCVHTVAQMFAAFERLIPWIALALLGFIGGKMLIEGIKEGRSAESSTDECPTAGECPTSGELSPTAKLGFGALLLQGIATSIDALSVGFTIAEYGVVEAVVSALIISAVTFVICMGGLTLGRRAGEHLSGKAGILGGVILIGIGVEIFLTGVL